MALSIAAAGQNVISSLTAFRGAIESENAAGASADVGSAQGVGDADASADAASDCDSAQEEDPRHGTQTTQSQELQEMLQLMKAFMDAIMSMNQQQSQDDDGFSPVSGGGGGQAPNAAGGTPDSGGGGQAPAGAGAGGAAGAGAAAPAEGGPPAAGATGPATGAQGPAAPGSSGEAGPSGLSTSAQTVANTPEQTSQIASQWKDNLKKDFDLTDDQARGVVGSLMHESAGMNSGITQGGKIGEPNGNMADDNGNGYGTAQWGGVRKQGLIDFAQKNGLPASSQAANYGFLKQELSGPYADAIKAVKGTGDVASATAAFTNTFEKPSDPQMASRIANAEAIA